VVLGQLAIRPYDPWAAWNHLIGPDLFAEFLAGFIVLAASLVGSLLFDRFFCKYLCPMGAFLAVIRRIGWFSGCGAMTPPARTATPATRPVRCRTP
jgi:polyferredoxin